MKNKIALKLMPDSSFLLGGVSVNPAYDAVTALDNGIPYLTATAVKGALRMDFESFARGIDEVKLCELDTDFHGCGVCLSCRLFGGGNEEGKLRFYAAFPVTGKDIFKKGNRDGILEKGKREGVSISRTLGKAKDKSYYSTLTFPNLKGSVDIFFDTHIDIQKEPDEEERLYLNAFFAFLERTGLFMGSRKSVGLGNFKVTCHIPDGFEQHGQVDTSKSELKLFRVTLETLEPLVVGNLKNKYIVNTLPYLPTSTLGGSIGFGFIKIGVKEDTVSGLFYHKHSFSPFNFYFQKKLPEHSMFKNPFPKPTSMRARKGEKEIEKDILLSDFILKKAIGSGKFKEVKSLFKSLYRSNLRPVSICEKPGTTYHTKVAIGRILQKTKKEMLYSMELIPKGSEFQGIVIGEEWTGDVLKDMELFIGGKRTRGFGRSKVLTVEEIGTDQLINPEVSIDKELRKMAKEFPVTIPDDRRYFTLDVLADLEVPPGKTLEFILKEELFAGMDVNIEQSYPDVIRRGGYSFKENEKKEKPLVEKIGAGSTFLVSVPVDKTETFTKKVARMVEESINHKWDSTPLFLLNNPKHKETWR